MPTILPVTICAAAAAAIINIWLGIRCGQMRLKYKVIHGDDGGGPLTRRMRAQINFVENTPWVLALIAAIELAGKGQPWLAWVAGIYMLGRVAHGGELGVALTQPLLGLGALEDLASQLAGAALDVGLELVLGSLQRGAGLVELVDDPQPQLVALLLEPLEVVLVAAAAVEVALQGLDLLAQLGDGLVAGIAGHPASPPSSRSPSRVTTIVSLWKRDGPPRAVGPSSP